MTCLLTLHFLDAAERRRTVAGIHRRLVPGAPFVAAHSSFPQGAAERDLWLSRYAAYAVSMGVDVEQTNGAREAVRRSLMTFDPATDTAILEEGGFRDVSLFFAAFTWRGWVATA
ncbi:hypothetical protein WI697_06230 [Tistrella mobilis]|uniref:hypothetical protein n=1 Tax=Tistrella mobilis TaxID=171437 RepID=UPI0031F64842